MRKAATCGYMAASTSASRACAARPTPGTRPSAWCARATTARGPWYAATAYERHHEYQGRDGNDSGAKIAAAYHFGATRVALIGERLKYETAAGTLERNAF